MIEPEVLTEVPAELKRLAKQVVRGFYGVEHGLALDVLIRNPCVREEDMLELLKFDRKQLRSVLNTLKADKFVKCRMRVETAPDGKTTRHNYYFINYSIFQFSFSSWLPPVDFGLIRLFRTMNPFCSSLDQCKNMNTVLQQHFRVLVNVVKYKLDHMRRRIETDERDSTNRASFRCPCCFSTFTDLEANQLFDPMSDTFRCTFCQTEVEEDASVCPDARTPVARFNEQIEPIYALLRETEDINLSHDLLEPEPTEIPALKQSRERAAAAGNAGPHREAWASKGSSYADLYSQNVEISMDKPDEQRQANEGKAPKERPIWLTQSTVQGADAEPDLIKSRAEAAPGSQDAAATEQTNENEEVMRALLIHEKRNVAGAASTATTTSAAAATRGLTSATANASDSESDTSESDDDAPKAPKAPPAAPQHHMSEDDDDDFEEVGEEHTVMVGGRPHSYSEVSQRPELVEQMSAQEKEAYIEMGQNLFQDMYY